MELAPSPGGACTETVASTRSAGRVASRAMVGLIALLCTGLLNFYLLFPLLPLLAVSPSTAGQANAILMTTTVIAEIFIPWFTARWATAWFFVRG